MSTQGVTASFDNAMARVRALQSTLTQLTTGSATSTTGTKSATGASTATSSSFATALGHASASVSGSTAGASGDRQAWAQDVLQSLGMPQTSENVRALVAWAQAEGTSATFNPLATTQGASGATQFNSVGVRNYPDYATGLKATVETLTNGNYTAILDALRRGTSATDVARAVANSPWGTGDGVLRVLGAA